MCALPEVVLNQRIYSCKMRQEKVMNLCTFVTLIFCVYHTIQTLVLSNHLTAIQWNMCITEEYIYAVLHDISIDDCMSVCFNEEECVAFGFHRLQKSCQIARSDDVLENLSVCKGYVFVEREDIQVVRSLFVFCCLFIRLFVSQIISYTSTCKR